MRCGLDILGSAAGLVPDLLQDWYLIDAESIGKHVAACLQHSTCGVNLHLSGACF